MQLNGSISIDYSAGKGITVFIVCKAGILSNGTGRYQRFFDFNDGTTNAYTFFSRRDNTDTLQFTIKNPANGTEVIYNYTNSTYLDTTRYRVYAVTFTNNSTPSCSIWVDGTSAALTTSSNVAMPFAAATYTNNYICKSAYTDPCFDLNLREFQYYSYPMTAAQMLAVSTYLMKKWDISTTVAPSIWLDASKVTTSGVLSTWNNLGSQGLGNFVAGTAPTMVYNSIGSNVFFNATYQQHLRLSD